MRTFIWSVVAVVAFGTPAFAEVFCANKKGVVAFRTACKKKEKLVDLTTVGAQGPKGDKGDKGDQGDAGPGFVGLEAATSSASNAALANNDFLETTATCPANKYVVSGRCAATPDLFIETSTGAGQTGNGAAYRCRGQNQSGGNLNVTITADIACAPLPS
jgi:hypothetical protein